MIAYYLNDQRKAKFVHKLCTKILSPTLSGRDEIKENDIKYFTDCKIRIYLLGQIEKNSEHELFQEKSCTARNDMFIILINIHMQNLATDEKVVTFERRPEFAGKLLTDSEIESCLEEAGQVGYKISIIFSNI